MPLTNSINNREYDKFVEDSNGDTAVRTLDEDSLSVLNKILGEYDSETQIATSQSLSSDFNSTSIDFEGKNKGFIRASWSGANNDNEATFVIEISADNTNWSQLGESGMALIVEEETQVWQFIEIPSRFARLAFTANGNSGGIVDIFWSGKT